MIARSAEGRGWCENKFFEKFTPCSQCDYIYIFASFECRYNSRYILFLLCLTSVAYRYIMWIFYLMRLDYAKIRHHKVLAGRSGYRHEGFNIQIQTKI